MNLKNVVRQPNYMNGRCPFCYEKLEIVEAVKRKIGRKCKCKKCNKIIDERFVKW